jgi:hypothetical protein
VKSPASGGWAGTFGRIVGGVVFGYAALVLTVGCVQRKLIYHPPGLAGGEQDAVVARTRLQPWTNGAGMRIGWWRPGGSSRPGSVLVVHGNAGAAAERAYLLDPIQQATGLDVFVLEYPGFAGRPGKPSQATLTAAADEGLGILCSSRMPVYVVGESLGTGVAAYLAGHHPENVRGVVLLTPFNSLTAAAGHHYPWLPVRWLLMDPYPSETWLASYPGPVGVVVGTADRVVPADFGQRLFEGYSGRKRLWTFEGEDHWDASHRPAEWWAEAFGFLREGINPVLPVP